MHWVDWVVLLGYAGTIIFIGWRASRGQRTAFGHLRADRSLPGWAVVFSILATEVSAATYVGVPETGYKGDWTYIQLAIGALVAKIVLSTWFIRLYWRLNLATIYGLLAERIGPLTQKTTAWSFLGGRLIASGVRLFIGALAFSVVTNLPVEGAIVVMAAISTVYTLLGGLRAVVWTDVAQGAIFFIGAATAISVGLIKLGMPLEELVQTVLEEGKLRAIAFDPGKEGWLASLRPLPIAVMGGFFLCLATHGTDQENVQHLLNTQSERASAWSIISSGLFTFPVVALFLATGTMLWLYHQHFAVSAYDPADTKRIFPNFIMHSMPIGLRGLVFAGLFAAAISSLGATLNAVTTAWLADLRGRRPIEGESLLHVRFLNLAFGVGLAGIALFFSVQSRDDKTDLVQIALGAMTMFYGGILGTFLVALLFKKRGSDASTTAGLIAGIAAGALIFFQRQIFGLHKVELSWPWSIPIAVILTLAIASTGRRRAPTGDTARALSGSSCQGAAHK